MDIKRRRYDRIRGCLLGGIIGDALGYQVENLSLDEIKLKYGVDGISYSMLNDINDAFDKYDIALSTFVVKWDIAYLCRRYFLNEKVPLNEYCYGILQNVLKEEKDFEATYNVLNKIAPLGLLDNVDIDVCLESSNIASRISDNPLTYLSCQYYVLIIYNIMLDDDRSLWRIAKDALKAIKFHYDAVPPVGLESYFYKNKEYVDEFVERMKNALILVKYHLVKQESKTARDNTDLVIESLGKGYSTEEALAIGLFCAVRYQSDPEQGVRRAVNHSGNSMYTGAIAGQLLGVFYGESIIPPYFTDNVKVAKEMLFLADEFAKCTHLDELNEVEKKSWKEKYLQ